MTVPLQETFEGLNFPLETGVFADLVHKHAYQPNIRFHVSRWGRYNNAPKETCTMTVGNINDGHAYNVPMPQMPAKTLIDKKTDRIKHRGWRELMQFLLLRQIVRPNLEFEMYLGTHEYEKILKSLKVRQKQ